jgi:hypothetical protein
VFLIILFMAKRRGYNPTKTPAKVALAVMANLAGRLPPAMQSNPIIELNAMMIANTASQEYAGKIAPISTLWRNLVRKYNMYGTRGALLRIMAGSLLKFQPRPGGGVVPCSDITTHLTAIATKARMQNEMAPVIDELAGYAKDQGWCTEAGGTPTA